MNDEFAETITRAVLQVRRECQFFGALMLFAQIEPSETVPTAATDGRRILMNTKYLHSLSTSRQNALLLHEVLHMALLHVHRLGSRDREVWNIAADIVVNDLIGQNTTFKLPRGAIVDETFRDQSVEQIYEDLFKKKGKKKGKKKEKYQLVMPDILSVGGSPTDEEASSEGSDSGGDQSGDLLDLEEAESYWRDAIQVLQNSESFSNGKEAGNLPLGMSKEITSVLNPEIDWRHALWKFVGKTPADFDELDRRFIYRGLYLEGLLTEALELFVCIDTSGSVSQLLLDKFIGELKGILSSYPHVKCVLFFADTEIYGPYEIDSIDKLPRARGFGGTSFIPFFEYLEKEDGDFTEFHRVAVYFTDGYGDFPGETPLNPVMWLVPMDGLESQSFPFGEVLRISSDSA